MPEAQETAQGVFDDNEWLLEITEKPAGGLLMGFVAVQIKLMPDSPSADLKEIEQKAEKIITSLHKTLIKVEEQPIAFGLKAILLSFAWNDEIETEKLEAELSKIEHVSSVETLDIRKAFG